MEEGTKAKKTVFVGGLGEDINEAVIYEHFSTFGTRHYASRFGLQPITVLFTQQATS